MWDIVIKCTPKQYEENEATFEQFALDLRMNVLVIDKDTEEKIMLIGGRI